MTRVHLYGASNLWFSRRAALAAIRRRFEGPLELGLACGPGRSYGLRAGNPLLTYRPLREVEFPQSQEIDIIVPTKAVNELARLCATEVVLPENIFCCGFAGDRGFNFPELNKAALAGLGDQVYGCEAGYSTSKTCEVGLALHGSIPYRSILALVDEVTTPLTA